MSVDSWKRASFLAGSESNVRQWEPLPGGFPSTMHVPVVGGTLLSVGSAMSYLNSAGSFC